VDPLSGESTNKRGGKDGEAVVAKMPEGVCGMLVASNAKNTHQAAERKYGENVRQWHVPSPHLGHYEECKPSHLTQVTDHKVLVIGMPESRVLAMDEVEKDKVAKIKDWLADAKASNVHVDIVWDQENGTVSRSLADGVSLLQGDDKMVSDFQMFSMEQKLLDHEMAKSQCEWFKKATVIVLWDDCSFKDGKRLGKHERKDCYDFDSADSMAMAQHLGIPTIAYGEKQAWKEISVTKGPGGDVQKDQTQLLFRLGRVVQDEKQWLRVHRQSLTKSNAFAVEKVLANFYEPMVEDAIKSCPVNVVKS